MSGKPTPPTRGTFEVSGKGGSTSQTRGGSSLRIGAADELAGSRYARSAAGGGCRWASAVSIWRHLDGNAEKGSLWCSPARFRSRVNQERDPAWSRSCVPCNPIEYWFPPKTLRDNMPSLRRYPDGQSLPTTGALNLGPCRIPRIVSPARPVAAAHEASLWTQAADHTAGSPSHRPINRNQKEYSPCAP
jgi:hypothetical protein